MGGSSEQSHYESLRNARIFENKARLESLGLLRTAGELRQIVSSSSPMSRTGSGIKRPRKVGVTEGTPLRRSNRLKRLLDDKGSSTPQDSVEYAEAVHRTHKRLFSGRCASKSRGCVYDPLLGICCHFCRQKKLCGEEDCKRCRDGNINEPCIGKTECAGCHSSNGILCRACLKVRYGEEMEEIRARKDWMCPHCIEEKGINPYWICNSSLCLKKKKMTPTGIAIYQARELGYESVAHLLMDELKRQAGKK